MRPNTLICISREYGSGGHEVAEMLSEKLGIKMYDKELIEKVAKMADTSEEFVKQQGESGNYSYIFGVPSGHAAKETDKNIILTPEKLFAIQSMVIKEIADQGESCIFVGRCADIILQKYPGCHTFFIHASEEVRLRRLMETENLTRREAQKTMKKTDAARASYHDFYTKIKWGHPSNYELIINAGKTGIERAADVIAAYLDE